MPIDTNVDKISDYNDFIELYLKHEYDAVFLDFTDKMGKSIFNFILNKDSKQRMVLLNDTFECFNQKDCFTCQKHYNISTLIKPIYQTQIAKIITNHIDCESYNKNEDEFNLEKVIKTICQKYPAIKFDREHHLFSFSFVIESLQTSILINLTTLLDEHTITYNVLDNYDIKIN